MREKTSGFRCAQFASGDFVTVRYSGVKKTEVMPSRAKSFRVRGEEWEVRPKRYSTVVVGGRLGGGGGCRGGT